jgi:hypothetical protein
MKFRVGSVYDALSGRYLFPSHPIVGQNDMKILSHIQWKVFHLRRDHLDCLR